MGRQVIGTKAKALTPGAGVEVLSSAGTLFIGGGGDLACNLIENKGGTPVVFKNIPDGTDFPRQVIEIDWDNTTCTDIILDV